MTKNKLKVLITRPKAQGRELVKKLAEIDIASISQPMFDYRLNTSAAEIKAILEGRTDPILIFVSCAAVDYVHQAWPLENWPHKHIIAVGTATQKSLLSHGLSSVCPEQHNSEGLLALDELTEVKGQNIIIIRGNGGRELIAEELGARGGKITYIESYQRNWHQIDTKLPQKWKKNQINCIVITSMALLEHTLKLLGKLDSYWQDTCLWIVASERIAKQATQAGLNNVINAHGASDGAIMTAISQNGTK